MIKKNYPLQIIYEDDFILVCDKPAGLPVQTAKSNEQDLVSQLKVYRQKKGEEPYIGVIHRLDQPVRGLIALAKTPAAAANLSKQIAARTPLKEYLAVIYPIINSLEINSPALQTRQGTSTTSIPSLPANGELRDYLLRDGRTNTSRVVSRGTPGAKEAVLSYDVLQTSPETGRSLVRIRLHTGRHHQIRVQFAHAGFPLYADSKYGQPLPKGEYCPVALCSCRIGFHHPGTGKWMEFTLDDAEDAFYNLL